MVQAAVMTVEPLCAQDVPELLALAAEWGSGPVVIAAGAHGAVVRAGGVVQAWALLRELNYGFVVDELWCRKDRVGRAALGEIARWLEATVSRIAAERGVAYIELGGIVRLDNPAHDAALEKRGYEFIGKVRAKKIFAREFASV